MKEHKTTDRNFWLVASDEKQLQSYKSHLQGLMDRMMKLRAKMESKGIDWRRLHNIAQNGEGEGEGKYEEGEGESKEEGRQEWKEGDGPDAEQERRDYLSFVEQEQESRERKLGRSTSNRRRRREHLGTEEQEILGRIDARSRRRAKNPKDEKLEEGLKKVDRLPELGEEDHESDSSDEEIEGSGNIKSILKYMDKYIVEKLKMMGLSPAQAKKKSMSKKAKDLKDELVMKMMSISGGAKRKMKASKKATKPKKKVSARQKKRYAMVRKIMAKEKCTLPEAQMIIKKYKLMD